MRLRPSIAACVLAGISFLVSALFISRISNAEIADVDYQHLVQQARSVRQGNTPVFFHADGETWLQPIPVYVSAMLQTMVPERLAARYASATAAAVVVAFVFLIAHAIAGTAAGFTAAIAVLLSWGHWYLQARPSAIFPALFVLLWMFGFVRFLKGDSSRALVGAALALGACLYSHPAGPLTASFLWVLTLAIAWRRNRVRLGLATATFIAAWLPAAAWFYLRPATYPDTFGRWFVFAAHLRNPLDGLSAFMNSNTLGTRASLYWGFLDPSWWFFGSGADPSPLVLLWAPLVLVALLRARHISRDAVILVIGTALIVPLAGATFGVAHYLNAAAAFLPLLAILAGLGLDQLVAIVTRRQPLEDDVAMAAVDGWHDDHIAPRS
jgi:hypothetical protein